MSEGLKLRENDRVAVIGAGPAGLIFLISLACGYIHLFRRCERSSSGS